MPRPSFVGVSGTASPARHIGEVFATVCRDVGLIVHSASIRSGILLLRVFFRLRVYSAGVEYGFDGVSVLSTLS